jgi:hypothetical protein
MRKFLIMALMALVLVVVLLWVTLSDFEFGKYDTFEEVLEKGIPYKVKEVIHTHNVDGITVLMYTTEPKEEDLPFADYDALAVVFLEGNDHDGWENVGPNGWTHYENNNMTAYYENYRKHDNKGNLLIHIPVTFGEINNADIQRVETKAKNSEEYNEVDIIEHYGMRYYFDIGYHKSVRGLSNNGKVIEQHGE